MTRRTVLGLTTPLALAAALAVPLTGCGNSSADATSTLAPTQATDFVVAYVSTTTTLPPVTTVPFASSQLSLPASGTIPTSTTSLANPAAGSGTYKIVAGDSVASIAKKHGMTVDDLVAANGWTDGIKHLLLPGDTIKVSGSGTSSASGASGEASSTGAADATGQGCTYKIKSGDNPSSVASKYGITVAELRSANTGGVMDTFLVGAELKIPANGNC